MPFLTLYSTDSYIEAFEETEFGVDQFLHLNGGPPQGQVIVEVLRRGVSLVELVNEVRDLAIAEMISDMGS